MDTPFSLRPSRVHEVQGPGRLFFALWQLGRYPAAIWVTPTLDTERPTVPDVTFVAARKTDILWAAEEALRGAPGALVLAQPEKPLTLTEGRRLQLAAEAGGTTGLLLVADGAGSAATETRWDCRQLAGDSTLHEWKRIKNKKGTIGSWVLDWNGASSALHMVTATGQRCGPAGTSG